MKHFLLTSMLLLCVIFHSNSQSTIKPAFVGINLFMPAQVGSHVYVAPPGNVESRYPLLKQTGIQIVRWGGAPIEDEINYSYIAQYKAKILEVKTEIGENAKIILQVPRQKILNDLQFVLSADGVNNYTGNLAGAALAARQLKKTNL